MSIVFYKNVEILTSSNDILLLNDILAKSGMLLILYSSGCPGCKKILDNIYIIQKNFRGNIGLLNVESDKENIINILNSTNLNIYSVPSFIWFRNGISIGKIKPTNIENSLRNDVLAIDNNAFTSDEVFENSSENSTLQSLSPIISPSIRKKSKNTKKYYKSPNSSVELL